MIRDLNADGRGLDSHSEWTLVFIHIYISALVVSPCGTCERIISVRILSKKYFEIDTRRQASVFHNEKFNYKSSTDGFTIITRNHPSIQRRVVTCLLWCEQRESPRVGVVARVSAAARVGRAGRRRGRAGAAGGAGRGAAVACARAAARRAHAPARHAAQPRRVAFRG